MSSTPNGAFAHYVSAGLYPGAAVKLVIGLYLEVDPAGLGWSCFIAASFYDRSHRVLWHKEICLLQRNDYSNQGWSATHGFDRGPPPPRERPVTRTEFGLDQALHNLNIQDHQPNYNHNVHPASPFQPHHRSTLTSSPLGYQIYHTPSIPQAAISVHPWHHSALAPVHTAPVSLVGQHDPWTPFPSQPQPTWHRYW